MVHQFYQSRVIDEFVLRGNTGILKCLVPSFVVDFVEIIEWISDDGASITRNPSADEYGMISYLFSSKSLVCFRFWSLEALIETGKH